MRTRGASSRRCRSSRTSSTFSNLSTCARVVISVSFGLAPDAARLYRVRMAAGHTFRGKLEELVWGRMRYWVIFLPARLESRAPFSEKKKLRMRGTVDGQPVALAWQLHEGRHYVMFGKAAAKKLGIALGATVGMTFTLVSDDDVEVPEELRLALAQEPEWRALWKKLTPGQQRGLAHMVNSAKRPETRAARAIDVMRRVEEGVVPGPPRRRAL